MLIRITAGSVVVAAEIFVADQTAATSTANSLADGALKDASSLETALKTQFDADGVNTATLTVEAITAGPSAQVAGGSIEDATNAAAGLGAGLLVVIILVPIILICLLILLIYCCCCKNKKAAAKSDGVTMTNIKTAGSA